MADQDYQPFHSLPSRRKNARRSLPPAPPAPRPPDMTPEARLDLRRARRMNQRASSRLTAPILILGLLFLLVVGVLGGYEIYLRDRAVPGVRVLGEEIGGMTRPQADERIREKIGRPEHIAPTLWRRANRPA